MPRDYREELIRLYAGSPVATMQNVAAFQQLCNEFAQDGYFLAERHRIEVAKVKVESVLDKQLTQQESVQKAIQFLIQTRGDDKQRDLCHELIVAGYQPRWNAAQQQYFDAAWQKIKLKYDYFLSFTTRYPAGVAGDNPINTAYQQFIISEITIDEYNKADRKKMNLLALAVHRLLSQPRIKGFYFPHTQYDNTVTEQKLQEACDNSLIFVQLVQAIMFDPPPALGTNYCFFEWNRVKTQFTGPDGEKRILFVVAAPDRNTFLGVLPFIDYNNWHDHIRQKDPPYLPEMEFRNEATLMEVKKTFQNKMVPEIRAAWFRLIDGAP
jgi:hypothetical protein